MLEGDNAIYFKQSATENVCSWCKESNINLLWLLAAWYFALKISVFWLLMKIHAAAARLLSFFFFLFLPRFPFQADSLLGAEEYRSAGGEINFSAHWA